MMQIEFRRNRMKREYENSALASREYGPVIGRNYIKVINSLRSFPDFDTLKAHPIHRFHRLKPRQPERYALQLTANYRLIIRPGQTPDAVLVMDVEDYH